MFAVDVTTVAEAALHATSAIAAIRIAALIRRSFEEGIECRVTLSPNSTTQVLRSPLLYIMYSEGQSGRITSGVASWVQSASFY
jgi:hypothetical protein